MVLKTTGNYQYAEALVNGKTGTRPIPLIDSIPYLKDYLDHEHPQPGNPNAPLICGVRRGLGRHMSSLRIYKIYEEHKKYVFPKLLESPEVLPEDKQKIRELLKKPWNPYIRRHSALTEKSTILKEHVLRQHAGWSGSSQMHLKYLHYFGNESNESLLEAYGIIDKGIQLDLDTLEKESSEKNISDRDELQKKIFRTFDGVSGERSDRSDRSDSIEMSTEEKAAKLREYDKLSALARKKSKAAAHVGAGDQDDHKAKPPRGVVGVTDLPAINQ